MTGTNHLTGAEAMVRMLEAHGVTHMFGLCGDTTLPFYDALSRMDHGIQHFLTRDERHAAYMADGYARASHRPGVCLSQDIGTTNLAAGIRDAHMSGSPVIAITGSNGKSTVTMLVTEMLKAARAP